MATVSTFRFHDPELGVQLDGLTEAMFDTLDFGVIGFDDDTVVRVYNSFESTAAGLSRDRVIGNPLFTIVAPCMNNFLIAQRFEDAAENNDVLDATIDYVLTLRMRPVKVKLRLIAGPAIKSRYVLLHRPS